MTDSQPSYRPGRFARLADRVGASASFLCALHCAALPFVFALLPAVGLGFLAEHGFERGFVAFASCLAASTLWLGFHRHRSFAAFALLLPGLLLLWIGVSLDGHTGISLHALLVSMGGILVTLAHLVNLRLSHTHVHGANCVH